MSRLAFHRPARTLLPTLPDEQVVLPLPPEMPTDNPQSNGWSLVLPLLSVVGMSAYMITFARPSLIIIGVLFFVTSTGAVVAMRLNQRGNVSKTLRKQRRRYRAHLKLARDQARAVADGQRVISALTHPEPARLWAIAGNRHRVWERRPHDVDFLRVRLGTGDVRLATPITMDEKLDPLGDYDWESARAANRLIERLGRIEGHPMVVDLGGAGVVSVLGPPSRTHELARAMLCQIAVLHAPEDVRVCVEASGGGQWEWAKWLPHACEPQARGPAGVRSLVAPAPEQLTDFLAQDLARRADLAATRRMQVGVEHEAPQQRLVVVFTGFAPVSEWGRSELLAALLRQAGPASGITLVFLVERESDEPGRVDLRVRLGDGGSLVTEGRADLVVTPALGCVADTLPATLADLVARELAPLRLSDEREQVLARTFSLSEMVLGGDPATADITARWVGPTDRHLMRVPIGTDGEGGTVLLDIKESAQGGFGPHGLVVGATGSGKSELLRTLVTGLALTHPPELLSFVLVDFKGGAAFAPLTDLPHVAGLITNLADDAALIDRVLAALVGEQQRRQRLLRDAGNVDSIREYQLRRAGGALHPDGRPLEPLPYLLIIVDEFGELLSGRPDFTDLFVQIGRVGRSLGMHLLLATQRLEEGRLRGLDSHLSYRICLRTFSAVESRTVIGTTDAYTLPPIPGSAYLKVDESIYQRLRIAHVSARYLPVSERVAAARPRDTVVPFGLRGEEDVLAEEEAEPLSADLGPTELSVVVGRLRDTSGPVHQVWLPPLPAALALDHLVGVPSARAGRGYSAALWPGCGQLRVPIGIIDIPVRQQQETLVMDFAGAHGHLAAVGAPRTGRSTLLRTVMMAGMLTHSPEETQFYCIDFGGGTLHAFARAPHVGGVAGRGDGELLSRMLSEIRALISERERLFRTLDVDSISEFRARRQAGRLPAGVRAADVFLMIDNWGAVRAEYDGVDATIADIAARGLGAGVHLVLTVGRWLDIRPALRDSIGTRIELRLNDPTESEISRQLAIRLPADRPGRGLVAPGAYFQLVLPRVDGDDSSEGLHEAQDKALASIAAHWSGPSAPPVRMLPPRITVAELDALVRANQPADAEQVSVPIAIAEDDLLPVTADLVRGEPHLLVFGDTGAGKTTALRTWISGLTARHSAWAARLVVLDYRRSLVDAVPPSHLGAYAGDPDLARTFVQQVVEKIVERLPPADVTPAQLRARDWWEGPEIYVVVDDYDMVATGPQSPLAPLAAYIPQARDVGLHLVAARRVSGISRGMMGDPLLNRIKDIGCDAVVLSGDPREGAVIGDVRAAPRPPGRGHLVRRGRPPRLIQVAMPDEPASDPRPAPPR